MVISDREKLVLNAIVNYYLTYGDTIGSRTLVKKYGIDLSSATIRNVMADLEDMGFISKTHSSSGRIPTDKGYKYYLEELLKVEKVSNEEKRNIEHAYEHRINELDKILETTSSLLSSLTSYTGITFEPKPSYDRISRVELVHVDSFLVIAIIILENRNIVTKKIHLVNEISKIELEELAVELNNKILNSEITINEIESFIIGNDIIIPEDIDDYYLNKFFIDNFSSILKNKDIDEVSEVIEYFSDKRDVVSLFENLISSKPEEHHRVNVIFGDDLGIKELEDYSLVYSVYNIGGSKGILGVIGPKRMAYSKTVGVLDHVTKELNKMIDKFETKVRKDD